MAGSNSDADTASLGVPAVAVDERSQWGMLVLAWMLYFCFAFTVASLYPIVGDVRADIGLTYAQVGLVFGGWQLIYLFAAVPVGMLVDRFPPRRVLFVGTLIVAASQLGRSLSDSFPMLLLSVALLGLGGPVMSVGLPKVIAEAFTGSRRALASGIYITGAQVGQMAALALTNVLTVELSGGWRSALQIYAAVVVVVAVVWVIFARDRNLAAGVDNPGTTSLLRGIRHVVRVPGIWAIVGIGFSGFLASHGYRSWLPEMLVGKGIDATTAGFMAAVPALFGIAGSIIIVRWISHRSRRVTIIALLTVAGAMMLAAVFATGVLLIVVIAIEGFCAAALMPLMMNILMEMPLIGPVYMGAAAGLYFSVGELGGFVGPSIIGALAGATGSFFAGLLVLSLVMWLMIVPAITMRLPN